MELNEKLSRLDQSIYTLVVNVISFLKTLKKAEVSNEKTVFISKVTKQISENFNKFYDDQSANKSFVEIKPVLKSLVLQIQKILIDNFEGVNERTTTERADLIISTDKLIKEIEEI